MRPREAAEYEHYSDRLQAEADDPCGAFLVAQVQKQFDALFPISPDRREKGVDGIETRARVV